MFHRHFVSPTFFLGEIRIDIDQYIRIYFTKQNMLEASSDDEEDSVIEEALDILLDNDYFDDFYPQEEIHVPAEHQHMLARILAITPKTKRGKANLMHLGCLFIMDRRNPYCKRKKWYKIYWKCKVSSCKARANTTRGDVDGPDENLVQTHGHTVNNELSPCSQLENYDAFHNRAKQLITELCMTEHLRYKEAYDAVIKVMGLYYEKIESKFVPGALEHVVGKLRRASFPAVPGKESHAPFHLPQYFQTTTKGKSFLQWNFQYVYEGRPGRIMIFGTSEFLTNLFSRQRVFIDGTFKIVPGPFAQLFSFHAFLNGNKVMIPFLYVFMTHKSKHAYDLMFNYLIGLAHDNGIDIKWKFFTCDFESGLLPSIMACFGDEVTIVGCFFHFCQAIYRKLTELGLQGLYKHDGEFRMFVRKTFALVFVPAADVPVVYNTFVVPPVEPHYAPKLATFMAYMMSTWLDPVVARFKADVWSVFLVTDSHFTNNHVEAWHHHLNDKCVTTVTITHRHRHVRPTWNPRIWKLTRNGRNHDKWIIFHII